MVERVERARVSTVSGVGGLDYESGADEVERGEEDSGSDV